MKKGIIALAAIGILLVATSGAWAYSASFTYTLVDSPGQVRIDVGIWDPSDAGAPAYTTGGFWGYEYKVKNLSYDTFVSTFTLDTTGVSVISVSNPVNWSFADFGINVQWTAGTGAQLYAATQDEASWFVIKSQGVPGGRLANAWSGSNTPAKGPVAGPSVPEPATMSLLGLGLLGLVGGVIRKKAKA